MDQIFPRPIGLTKVHGMPHGGWAFASCWRGYRVVASHMDILKVLLCGVRSAVCVTAGYKLAV